MKTYWINQYKTKTRIYTVTHYYGSCFKEISWRKI
jgi:hypothetical protein